MTESLFEDKQIVDDIVEEQQRLFRASSLIKPLRAAEALGGGLDVICVSSADLLKGFPAKVTDNPRKDTLTVTIDVPTVTEMVRDYTERDELTEEDMTRLYVGAGYANFLMRNSLSPTRSTALRKFTTALTEPNGLYGRTMESSIFDDFNADEAARTIVAEGDIQTTRVNAARLITGLFFEVQSDPKATRIKFEAAFQKLLKSAFEAEDLYKSTVGLFGVEENEAKDLHTNTIEFILGLSFPMVRSEIKKILDIIK